MRFLIIPFMMTALWMPQDIGKGSRVIFLGDSITQQGDKPNGYVSLIREHFGKTDSTVSIIGAGISGNKVPNLLARLDTDVVDLKPTLVVIYIGINDVWHFTRGNGGTPKDKYREGLGELVARIRKAGSKVLLCTPSVIGEKKPGENPLDAMLDEYAGISRAVAKEMSVPVCDLREAFGRYERERNTGNAEKGILTTDGVHLNEAGNRFVADELLKALQESR